MGKKILIMSLALVMTLSLTACNGEPSAQEIVDRVIESFDNIRTYQFDVDVTIEMAGEAEGEAVEGTMVMAASGALDTENRQVRADITMSVAMSGEQEMEAEMEMYLISDTAYMMMGELLGMPMWIKSEIPEGTWEQMSQTESQIELLKTAEVEVIGSEKVKGVDYYVLRLTPDMEQLWQLAMRQPEVTGRELPDIAEEFIQEMFRSFSVKQWIAKDTYFLTKAEVDMSVELTPEAMGFPEEEGGITMDISMTLLAYDYNKPVSIILPPEAEEALDVTQQQWGGGRN